MPALNLSEAVELLRKLSNGLHTQKLHMKGQDFVPSLDKAREEATAFIASYDECEAALVEQANRRRK